jgi:glycerate kinase
MDSLKGSLSSFEANKAIAQGFSAISSDFYIVTVPIADGGEGTVESLVNAANDAGVGMLQGLGYQSFTQEGELVGFGGGELKKIATIDPCSVPKQVKDLEFRCQVNLKRTAEQIGRLLKLV